MSDLKLYELPGGVLYIKNAFPEAKEFLAQIEANDKNEKLNSVIPEWQPWIDGSPVKRVNDDNEVYWEQVLDPENGYRGSVKNFDWDKTLNDNSSLWPRKDIDEKYDEAHFLAHQMIRLIDEPYREVLKIWSEKTGNEYPSTWITKNYTLRRYRTGGNMGAHIDKNIDNPKNSMDWTALIYLDDDYEGGQLVFDNLGYELKPEAGSVVFFPCLETHSVREIVSGTKSYIFLFIHLDVGISTALGEPYQGLTQKIKDSRV